MKRKIFFTAVISLLLPFVVSAQNVINPSYFYALFDAFGFVLSFLPALLFGVGVAILFWGLFKMVGSSGNEDARKEGRRIALWGVAGLVIMVSIYAIIAIFQTFFGLGGGQAPEYPQIHGRPPSSYTFPSGVEF